MRGITLVAIFGLSALPLLAQEAAWTFRWKVGDSYTYQIKQTTTVDEVSIDEKTKKPVAVKTVTTLTSTKSWKVLSEDKSGVRMELSIGAMKQELTQTVGDSKPNVRVLDSAKADDAKDMPFLGKPILTATLNTAGECLEAKSENKTAGDRLKVELPFRLAFPDHAPVAKETWERNIALVLPPPQGAGERLAGVQTYMLRGTKDDFAVIGLTTKLKEKPGDDAMMAALVPVLWEGDLFFNTKTFLYHGARLKVSREIPNHRGEGTSFKYTSEYTEALDPKAK